jgi:hypothetical protein
MLVGWGRSGMGKRILPFNKIYDVKSDRLFIFGIEFYFTTFNNTKMNNVDLWKILSVTIFGSSVTTIIVEILKDFVKEWLSARRGLKNKRDEKRDEKRLNIYDEIYAKLNEMSSLNSINEDIATNIEQLETILREKNLYIETKKEKIVLSACDHFRSVINREANRNIGKEKSFLSDFKKEFNK